MKEYMLIAVCMLAGKYVDVPIWLNIFFGISAAWAVRQMEADCQQEIRRIRKCSRKRLMKFMNSAKEL